MIKSCRLFLGRLGVFVMGIFLLASCSSSRSITQPPGRQSSPAQLSSEGMWLMPQLNKHPYPGMQRAGLALSAQDLYRPDSVSLNRAVVRINRGQNLAGSGSFVSPKGLVLTNYHAVLPAVTNISKHSNYLESGFYADSLAQEIPLPDYTLYIPIEQKEVTQQINSRLADTLTFTERQRQIQRVKKKLILQQQRATPNLHATINDFWAGNRQFMSVYKVIRDVRLVHVPPEAIANLSGNWHNWQWPRYSGGYAFLRAYVGSNGDTKSYRPSNVPFQPDRHLQLDRSGASEGDLTITMGFPGQTSRQKSSYALAFYRDHQMPVITEAYEAILTGLRYTAKQDSQAATQNAARRAEVAHTLQYYRNVRHDFDKYDVVEQARQKEHAFEQWIKQDSLRNLHYHRVLPQLEQAYDIASQTGDLLYATVYTLNNCRLFEIANLYHSYRKKIADTTLHRVSSAYKDSLLHRHRKLLEDTNITGQQKTLANLLHMLATLPDGKVPFELMQLFGDARGDTLKTKIDRYLHNLRQQSLIYNPKRARTYLNMPVDSARAKPVDGFVELYRALLENYQFSRKNYVQHVPYRNPAQELYVQAMQQFRPDSLQYPDANGTLRLSAGRVNEPQVDNGGNGKASPFTYLQDMDSAADRIPPKLRELRATASANISFASGALPVNFLTTNDITGGNNGSPVLNKNGEVVGIAYNSNLKGAVGDYFYNPGAKRAINVDIRYILFLMDRLTPGNRLLDELTIQP